MVAKTLPVQAVRLDRTFNGRTRWRPARRYQARATGGWLIVQRALVISGAVAWLGLIGAFVARVLGLWPL